jgi:hypothetical protein
MELVEHHASSENQRDEHTPPTSTRAQIHTHSLYLHPFNRVKETMLYKILCPCLRSVQMDDIDVDVGDCIHSVEMESNSLARNDSLQQEQQKMPEEEVNDDITNNNNNNIAFIELNPLAKEITPSEYESKWKSYPLSTTRYYELIAEEGIEIDFEQMLGVHYIYTLASGQQQSNLIKSYLYAEEVSS